MGLDLCARRFHKLRAAWAEHREAGASLPPPPTLSLQPSHPHQIHTSTIGHPHAATPQCSRNLPNATMGPKLMLTPCQLVMQVKHAALVFAVLNSSAPTARSLDYVNGGINDAGLSCDAQALDGGTCTEGSSSLSPPPFFFFFFLLYFSSITSPAAACPP